MEDYIIMIFIVRGAGIHLQPMNDEPYLKIVHAFNITVSDMPMKWLLVSPFWLMFVVTVLTAWSGVRYLVFNWKVLLPPYRRPVEKR